MSLQIKLNVLTCYKVFSCDKNKKKHPALIAIFYVNNTEISFVDGNGDNMAPLN